MDPVRMKGSIADKFSITVGCSIVKWTSVAAPDASQLYPSGETHNETVQLRLCLYCLQLDCNMFCTWLCELLEIVL
jgi:hypothetical protein